MPTDCDKLRLATISQVRAAFAGVSRGEGMSLHEAVAHDDGDTSEEQLGRAREEDKDRTWLEIPVDELDSHPEALSFLCPMSWRYYIPAFVLRVIDTASTDPGAIIHDSVIYSLFIFPGLREYQLDRFRSLDAQQASAIARFLQYMLACQADAIDAAAAQQALDDYWSEFAIEN